MPAWTRLPIRMAVAATCVLGAAMVHAQDRHASVQAELTALAQAQTEQHQTVAQVRASARPIGGVPWTLLATGGVLCGLMAWGGWALAGRRRPGPEAAPPARQASTPATTTQVGTSRPALPAAPLSPARTQPGPCRPVPSATAPEALLLPPAERLRSLAALLKLHDMLVAIGQPLRAVRLLQAAAAGSQGDCLVPWLALLALRRSLGDAEGFQQDWLALQRRLGPVPAGVLLRQDGETAAVERHPWLAQALVRAWQSADPAQGLHALLFERAGGTVFSLEACGEILLLALMLGHFDDLQAPGAAQPPAGPVATPPVSAAAGSGEPMLQH